MLQDVVLDGQPHAVNIQARELALVIRLLKRKGGCGAAPVPRLAFGRFDASPAQGAQHVVQQAGALVHLGCELIAIAGQRVYSFE